MASKCFLTNSKPSLLESEAVDRKLVISLRTDSDRDVFLRILQNVSESHLSNKNMVSSDVEATDLGRSKTYVVLRTSLLSFSLIFCLRYHFRH